MPVESAIATVAKFAANSDDPATPTTPMQRLKWFIDNELEDMKRWREQTGLKYRMDNCLLLREGEYSITDLQAIQAFGGTEVFARLTTNKIRGGAALMRSIFVQGERPWEIRPTPVPTLPDDVKADIETAVTGEVQTMQAAGQPADPAAVKRRIQQMSTAAMSVARKQAKQDAIEATRYVDDILEEGGFYQALNAFILDFCTLPYACLRGPVAKMKTGVVYVNGQPTRARRAVLTYDRVDPYDIMWTAGSSTMDNADIIERMRLTRADLNALIGLDGYDDDAIRSAIRAYGVRGLTYTQFYEQVREDVQNRDTIYFNKNIDVLAYNGRMRGADLEEYKIPLSDGSAIDRDMDYLVQAWLCGEFILKVQVDPDPSNRVCYYVASYEPVPGSIAGTALPELIADIQQTYNATLRALINNLAVSSGPQVSINYSRWEAEPGGEVRIEPWKIWFYRSDPTSNAAEKPIEFFQPNLNSQELMNVLLFLQNMADEISGIPRYLTGSDRLGGAGRTSSGLSMLMGNANRTMTSVAGGIDENVIEPCLKKTYDLVLLTTGTSVLRGDEQIAPRGATYAETREQDRMRQIEFLNTTMNPVDMQIIGLDGRANLLRHVANGFTDGEDIVPSQEDMAMKAEAQRQQQQLQNAADPNADPNAPPGGAPQPGGPPQPGGSPMAQGAQRAPAQQAAKPTDNSARVRSQSAIRRQTAA